MQSTENGADADAWPLEGMSLKTESVRHKIASRRSRNDSMIGVRNDGNNDEPTLCNHGETKRENVRLHSMPVPGA
jgi:hypothetical protein